MVFDLEYDSEWVVVKPQQRNFLTRLLAQSKDNSIRTLAAEDREVAFALAQIRMVSEGKSDVAFINEDAISMRHEIVASLDAQSALALGLPPDVDLTFRTDVVGSLGTPTFQLEYSWMKFGRVQMPKRVGSILETDAGSRRIPSWLLDAIDMVEKFKPGTDLAEHWEALAKFRKVIEPGVEIVQDSEVAKITMTDFLKGLEVRLADSFSIEPKQGTDGYLDFDPVPFLRQNIEDVPEDEISQSHGELQGERVQHFQERVRERGALPAYRVEPGSFIVIDRSAHTALEVMCKKQHAEPNEREEFIRNPRAAIAIATAERLREVGDLDGLAPEGEEELVESTAASSFVETVEYSERVIGTKVYEQPDIEILNPFTTTWLPEEYREAAQAIEDMGEEELGHLAEEIRSAIAEGSETVVIAGVRFPANEEILAGIEDLRERVAKDEAEEDEDEESDDNAKGPLILGTKENFFDMEWRPNLNPREADFVEGVPTGVLTELKKHQMDCLEWQKDCWISGLPGVLNADEQGLGKTLETIAFLRAVQDQGTNAEVPLGPVLVVAPTTLLATWEAEVNKHTDSKGIGTLIRLFGYGLGGYKSKSSKGLDTETGKATLDLSNLEKAVSEGKGHRFWLLTTYTTLTNYHHSLARIPFSVVVFDEIQNLKNPGALRSYAARAIHGNFRIGLTGTPIENRTSDLWAVMDQLVPGVLGTLDEFNEAYRDPDLENMKDLHKRVFLPQKDIPRLSLRRTKSEIGEQLPRKARKLHPRLMPKRQMEAYDAASIAVRKDKGGLRAIHHIRSVSVHPDLAFGHDGNSFVFDSGRMEATFEVLHKVKDAGERALVFIEHRLIQYQFAEIACLEFGLARIDIINGSTPIRDRKVIVDRFQSNLSENAGFDILVLATRAAGTGLTLTAATHVIHLSRWWNPAVEEQCNDRVHRIGQERDVTVHVPMAIHPRHREKSFDCLLDNLMTRKRNLANSALWPMGDTESDVSDLRSGLVSESNNLNTDTSDPIVDAISRTFAADGRPPPKFEEDGSIEYL